MLRDRILPKLSEKLPVEKARWTPRGEVAKEAKHVATDFLAANHIELNLLDQRDLVTSLVNSYLSDSAATPASCGFGNSLH